MEWTLHISGICATLWTITLLKGPLLNCKAPNLFTMEDQVTSKSQDVCLVLNKGVIFTNDNLLNEIGGVMKSVVNHPSFVLWVSCSTIYLEDCSHSIWLTTTNTYDYFFPNIVTTSRPKTIISNLSGSKRNLLVYMVCQKWCIF